MQPGGRGLCRQLAHVPAFVHLDETSTPRWVCVSVVWEYTVGRTHFSSITDGKTEAKHTHTPLYTHTTNWKALNRYIFIYWLIDWCFYLRVILTCLINSETINSLQFKICFYLDNEKSDTTTHVTSCRDTWGMKISPKTEQSLKKKKKTVLKEIISSLFRCFSSVPIKIFVSP